MSRPLSWGRNDEGGNAFNPANYYTKTQSDARYVRLSPGITTEQTIQGIINVVGDASGTSAGSIINAFGDPSAPAVDVFINAQNDDGSNFVATGARGRTSSTPFNVTQSLGGYAFQAINDGTNPNLIRFYMLTVGGAAEIQGLRLLQVATDGALAEWFGVTGDNGTTGKSIIKINNRVAAPTTNPTGGGFSYAQAGADIWRGSGGTVTTEAPA